MNGSAGSHGVPEPTHDVDARAAARAFRDYVEPELEVVGPGQPAAASALHAECAERLAADLGASPSWSLADVGLRSPRYDITKTCRATAPPDNASMASFTWCKANVPPARRSTGIRPSLYSWM